MVEEEEEDSWPRPIPVVLAAAAAAAAVLSWDLTVSPPRRDGSSSRLNSSRSSRKDDSTGRGRTRPRRIPAG